MADLDGRAQNNMILIMVIHIFSTTTLGIYGTATFIMRCLELFQLDESLKISSNVIKISQTIPSAVFPLIVIAIVVAAFIICSGGIHARSGLYLIGLVDLICGSLLLAAAVLQGTYMPLTFSGCENIDSWPAWGELYIMLAKQSLALHWESDSVDSPQDECHDYLIGLVFTILGTIIFLIMACIGLFNPSGKALYIAVLPVWLIIKCFWWCLVRIGRFCQWCWPVLRPTLMFLISPILITRWILHQIIPTTVFTYRFLCRSRKSKHEQVRKEPALPKDVDIHSTTPKASLSTELSNLESYGPIDEKATLERILRNDKILMTLARHSHFQDLANLSSTSKSILAISLPRSSLRSRISLLRQISCKQDSKFECRCCGSQICDACESQSNILLTPQTTSHILYCQPRCSRCYYAKNCKRGEKSPCSCYYLRRPVKALGRVRLCSYCQHLSRKNVLSRIEDNESSEIQHLARQQLKCGQCEQQLSSSGPRWWCCSNCSRECTSGYHPAWAGMAEV